MVKAEFGILIIIKIKPIMSIQNNNDKNTKALEKGHCIHSDIRLSKDKSSYKEDTTILLHIYKVADKGYELQIETYPSFSHDFTYINKQRRFYTIDDAILYINNNYSIKFDKFSITKNVIILDQFTDNRVKHKKM